MISAFINQHDGRYQHDGFSELREILPYKVYGNNHSDWFLPIEFNRSPYYVEGLKDMPIAEQMEIIINKLTDMLKTWKIYEIDDNDSPDKSLRISSAYDLWVARNSEFILNKETFEYEQNTTKTTWNTETNAWGEVIELSFENFKKYVDHKLYFNGYEAKNIGHIMDYVRIIKGEYVMIL